MRSPTPENTHERILLAYLTHCSTLPRPHRCVQLAKTYIIPVHVGHFSQGVLTKFSGGDLDPTTYPAYLRPEEVIRSDSVTSMSSIVTPDRLALAGGGPRSALLRRTGTSTDAPRPLGRNALSILTLSGRELGDYDRSGCRAAVSDLESAGGDAPKAAPLPLGRSLTHPPLLPLGRSFTHTRCRRTESRGCAQSAGQFVADVRHQPQRAGGARRV